MPEFIELYKDLVPYSIKKNWNIGYDVNDIKNQAAYSNNVGTVNGFSVNVFQFPMWKELIRKKYTDKELIYYFLEMIRDRFPKYKGLTITFLLEKDKQSWVIEKI